MLTRVQSISHNGLIIYDIFCLLNSVENSEAY